MKVKHTKNGNVKLVMSLEQANRLKDIIDNSEKINYLCGEDKVAIEKTSWKIYEALRNAEVYGHG